MRSSSSRGCGIKPEALRGGKLALDSAVLKSSFPCEQFRRPGLSGDFTAPDRVDQGPHEFDREVDSSIFGALRHVLRLLRAPTSLGCWEGRLGEWRVPDT